MTVYDTPPHKPKTKESINTDTNESNINPLQEFVQDIVQNENKNSTNPKIDISNIQGSSKMQDLSTTGNEPPVHVDNNNPKTTSLKNSKNLEGNGKQRLSEAREQLRNFQLNNYINNNRGASHPTNTIGFDQSSDIFDKLSSDVHNPLSSTRRSMIDQEQLIRSAELVAEERMRTQNEKHQVEMMKLLNAQNQNKVIEDQKTMIENLQLQLAEERSKGDTNNKSLTSDDIATLVNSINLSSSTTSKLPGANERRPKILEYIAKNPIEQWQFGVSGNLYVFLRFKAEPYLKTKSFTKAETAQAISGIFSQSHYAETKAQEICMSQLTDHPETLNDRIEVYKALATELDENGGITIEPLSCEERVIDLFLRCKLILECELDSGEVEPNSEAEAKLNHRAIKRMLNSNENLMPEIDQEKIAALWNSMQVSMASNKGTFKTEHAMILFNNYDSMRVLRMQNNIGERRKQVKDLADKRTNSWTKREKNCDICGKFQHTTQNCPIKIYGPCEKCLANGMPRQRIKHTTIQHRFDSNYPSANNNRNYNNNQQYNNQSKFRQAPEALRKYGNNRTNFNLMDKEEISTMKDRREMVINDEGYACIRVEVDNSIVEIILDTGCLFEGVIENSMVDKLNLLKYKVESPTTIRFADGNQTKYDTILEVPMRFKNHAKYLKIVVMDKLPAKFILGTPGMQKLGMKFDITSNNKKND